MSGEKSTEHVEANARLYIWGHRLNHTIGVDDEVSMERHGWQGGMGCKDLGIADPSQIRKGNLGCP